MTRAEEQVFLEITVVEETAQEIAQEIAAQGWDQEGGLGQVLAAGLDYLQGRRVIPAVENELGTAEYLQRTLSLMVEAGTRMASTLYRRHCLKQELGQYETTTGRMMAELPAYEQRLWQMIREKEALRAELSRLHGQLAVRRTPPARGAARRPLWSRWVQRLARGQSADPGSPDLTGKKEAS